MLDVNTKILEEVTQDAKSYYDDEDGIFIKFYPKLDRAYVNCLGDERWIDAIGISDAIYQYQQAILADVWYNKRDIKII